MALDPSIALAAGQNLKSFDLGGLMKTGLEIQQGRQALELGEQKRLSNEIALRFQEPTAQAALAKAQMEVEAERRKKMTQKAFSDAIRAKGTRDSKTGKWVPPSDEDLIGHIAENGGVDVIDPTAMYSYLTAGSTSRQTAEGAKQQTIKTAADLTDLVNKRADALDTYARLQQDPLKVAQMAGAFQAANHADAALALGPEGAQAADLAMQQRYGKMEGMIDPVTGKPDPLKLGQAVRATATSNATAKAINPQQAIANQFTATGLAQGAEGLAQSGAAGTTSADARNPGSAVSRALQEQLKAAGFQGDVSKISAAQITNAGGLNAFISANIVPAGTKAAAAEGAVKAQQDAQALERLAAAAKKLPNFNFTPAQIIANKVTGPLLNDPNVREYISLVQQANAAGITLPENSPGGVAQFATNQAGLRREQGKTQTNLVKAPTFSTTGNEAPVPAKGAPKGDNIIQTKEYNGKKYIYDGNPRFPGGASNLKNWKVQ
jgi:hypothetical protein